MADDAKDAPPPGKDVFRESPLRLAGYANEVGVRLSRRCQELDNRRASSH